MSKEIKDQTISRARAMLLENEREYRLAKKAGESRDVLDEYRAFSVELIQILDREAGEE